MSQDVCHSHESTAGGIADMAAKSELVVLLMCAATSLTACSGEEAVTLQKDAALSAELTALRRDGGSAELSEWAGHDWDSVYVSHQPVSRDYVESQVGGEIDMDDTFTQQGNILVFSARGEIVRARFITPDLLPPGRYSSRVRITGDGYPALLQMSE
jgi:hypothetical protein